MYVAPNQMGKTALKEKVFNYLIFCGTSNTFHYLVGCVWISYILLEWLLYEDNKEKYLCLVEPLTSKWLYLYNLGTSWPMRVK